MSRSIFPVVGKSPFKLRRRLLKDGRFSLFIDRFSDGSHHYQFLKMYLLPETSDKSRRQNLQTLQRAEEIIKQLRIALIYNKESKVSSSGDILLNDFIIKLISDYKKNGKKGHKQLETARGNLNRFRNGATLNMIDSEFCTEYFLWLKNGYKTSKGKSLSDVTIAVYFKKLGLIISYATKWGLVSKNVWSSVDKVYKRCGKRVEKRFLTREELLNLMNTPYYIYEEVREAFLFSCFSGLRISDVRNLRWEEIGERHRRFHITKIIRKTGKPLTIPLPWKAKEFLPQPEKTEGLVFENLPSHSSLERHLNRWIETAGLIGRIHFHVARHTFATLLLAAGVEFYSVSKLLGHSDIRATQRYANIIDKTKEEAIMKIDNLF